jgi:hypothetical protein
MPIVAACVVMAISSIHVLVMFMTTLDVNVWAIMVLIAGMFVSWSLVVMIAITIMIPTNPNCHPSWTNVNVLGHRGCRDCER